MLLENDTPDSTSLESFDINEVIARAMADEAEPDAETPVDDEDGPGEELGELPEDPDDAVEDDEPEEEEEVDEAPEAPQEPEAPPPVEETPPESALEAEIRELRALVVDSQRANAQLLDLFGQQQRAAQQPAVPDVSPEIVKLLLFGGDASGVDPAQLERGKRVAQSYIERESRAALDPALRYQDIRAAVMADVQQAVGPILQEHYEQRAKVEMAKHQDLLNDPSTKSRLRAVFEGTPGWDSPDFAMKQRAFEVAAAQVRVEKKQAALTEAERRVKAAEAQQKANRQAAKKASGLGKPRSVGKAAGSKRPEFRPDTDVLEYFNTLLAGD